ncbi:MAG: hypothetical protein ACLR6I_08100 [Waltera sp.]
MLKVFLVEDEFVIREGIKNNIDWKAHGYEFCGEAGDGELAYPMIQKLRPDIVITRYPDAVYGRPGTEPSDPQGASGHRNHYSVRLPGI